jgi:signal transduction histidine kinase
VTAQRTSSRELLAGRFEVLSRLADDLAHEIKNPLHAMVINLEVLKRRVATGNQEGALDRVAVLEHELRRVNDLIHRLLMLLRPDREGVQLLDVDEVLGEIVPLLELQARVSRVPFEYRAIGRETRAPIQRDALAYALIGLAADALPHAGEGAPLTVVADRSDGSVVLSVGPTGRYAAEGGGVTLVQTHGAVAVAADLLKGAGANAEWRPAEGGNGVFCIMLPYGGGA